MDGVNTVRDCESTLRLAALLMLYRVLLLISHAILAYVYVQAEVSGSHAAALLRQWRFHNFYYN